jgi:hypothetical protein
MKKICLAALILLSGIITSCIKSSAHRAGRNFKTIGRCT